MTLWRNCFFFLFFFCAWTNWSASIFHLSKRIEKCTIVIVARGKKNDRKNNIICNWRAKFVVLFKVFTLCKEGRHFLSSHALCFSRPFLCSITQQHCSLSLSFVVLTISFLFLSRFFFVFVCYSFFVEILIFVSSLCGGCNTAPSGFINGHSFIPISSTE